jgi:hypothetical protein
MTGLPSDEALAGITPRAIEELFSIADRDASKFDFKFKLNMLELYKNDLQDLLLSKKDMKDPPKLKVKRTTDGKVEVENAVLVEIGSKASLHDSLAQGHSMRKTASTKMNSESSRSHLVSWNIKIFESMSTHY